MTEPSKLDAWVTIHFKEDSIPCLRRGQLTEESKQAIKALMIEIVRDTYDSMTENDHMDNLVNDLEERIENL